MRNYKYFVITIGDAYILNIDLNGIDTTKNFSWAFKFDDINSAREVANFIFVHYFMLEDTPLQIQVVEKFLNE